VRHIGRIGTALLAVGVAAALLAAPAAAALFHYEATNTIGKGVATTEQVFTIEGSTVKCKKAQLLTNLEEEMENTLLPMTVSYSECSGFGFATATVNGGTGCQLDFSADTTLHGTENTSEAELATCNQGPLGNALTITASNALGTCKVEIRNQKEINRVTYANMTEGGFKTPMTATLATTNLGYVVAQSTGICPLNANGFGIEAKYSGTFSIAAVNGGNFWWG
jgi:hypothetical protein